MKIVRDAGKMQSIVLGSKIKRKRIGFVPTMGALHQGHLSLVAQARKDTDIVAVSIFVNPRQFGPNEDYKRYPRQFKNDAYLCSQAGVDFIFRPNVSNMYPASFKTYVEVKDLSNLLCGAERPGHFRGVTTVVAKLFNILQPDIAYFGQKDAQQAIIIEQMVRDLNIPVKIKVMPIVRDKDGLALSSRNSYLTGKEKIDALVLSKALSLAKDAIKSGNHNPKEIIQKMQRLIQAKKAAKIDYISIVDPLTLEPIKKIKRNCLISLAVWIGRTRLIDNAIYG